MPGTIAGLLCIAVLLTAGAGARPRDYDYVEEAQLLLQRPDVKTAFEYIDGTRDQILKEWIAITEINAPSGKERQRADAVRKLLEGYKLDKVYFDAKGNLIAVRNGTGGAKPIVFDAHLDTVFKDGLKIKAEMRNGKLYAPGVGDDTRNVIALLASIRALNHAGIRTASDLVFVFTVEEETSFGGAKAFIAENKNRIGAYVALDGGFEGMNYAGIGINWYKFHFIGPGGHTRSTTPPYSATLPAARAIARIYSLDLPKEPEVNLNVGMLGGAEVVNAKAADAWFTVDLRSTDQKAINEFEQKITDIVREEAERAGMKVKTELPEEKIPAAQIPGHRDSPLVRISEAVHRAMGFQGTLGVSASNNANVALLAGLPAISTGAAPCGGDHSLDEWCLVEPFYRGIKKILMLEVALAGPAVRHAETNGHSRQR